VRGEAKRRDFSPPSTPQRGSRRLKAFLIAGVAVFVFSSVVGASLYMLTQGAQPFNGPTWTVKREKLVFSVVERGALESADNADIYCRVKAGAKGNNGSTTIKWIIDDGTAVVRGQKLIELDDSGLQEERKKQLMIVAQANAAKIGADANYQIVLSQNQSEIAAAKLNRDITQLDYEKYDEAEYDRAEFDVMAKVDMQRARSNWSNRMAKKGYYSLLQAKADENELIKYEKELKVLTYDKRRFYTDLLGKKIEAEKQLERVIIQAKSKEEQALVDLETKTALFLQEQIRLAEIEDQINECLIYAPQAGLVVYYMPESSRFRSTSQSVIGQGEPVREGQKLMQIPDLNRMQVNTNVHEAMVSRIRGERNRPTGFSDGLQAAMLINVDLLGKLGHTSLFPELRERFRGKDYENVFPGHRATIRIDAFPTRLLRGHVKSVGAVASQAQFMASDVKVYKTVITIDESAENLKPGMSAEVTIFADESSLDVLSIPIQSVVGNIAMGAKRKCFVVSKEGIPEMRDIVVGMSNTKLVEVREGLNEGEKVVLNPRPLLDPKSDLKAANPGKSKEVDGEPAGEKKIEKKSGGAAGGAKMLERYQSASPTERKAMLEQVPEDKRGAVRNMLKSKGLEVAD